MCIPKARPSITSGGGAIWVGGTIGEDTLVTTAHDGWLGVFEMFPESYPEGEMMARTAGDPDAISDQDFIAEYFDTLTDTSIAIPDDDDARPHFPLNIKTTQQTYAWSNPPWDDFILYDITMENIGSEAIESLWVGFFVDGDVFHRSNSSFGFRDDLTGYLRDDDIAYIMDNDGDPVDSAWVDSSSARDALGVKLIHSNPPVQGRGFNWWAPNGNTDFDRGPQRYPGDRNFSGGYGTPEGDKQKYRFMAGGEIDYDQIYMAVDFSDSTSPEAPLGWNPPHLGLGPDIADGYDALFLYTFGPYHIDPGESVTYFVALGFGDNVHVSPTAFDDYFDLNNPRAFYDMLNFDGLRSTMAHAEKALAQTGLVCSCPHQGDIDGSGSIGMVDIVSLINYLFRTGIAPPTDIFCDTDRGNVNCDAATTNVLDIVWLIDYAFHDSNAPCDPCGP